MKPDTSELLVNFRNALEELHIWETKYIEKLLVEFCRAAYTEPLNLIHALRIIIGQTSVFEGMNTLGREQTIQRINATLCTFNKPLMP